MKQTKQQAIPVHRMDTQTPLGIEFGYLDMTDEYNEIMVKSNKNVIHRDDYYMFLFMEAATAIFSIDFEEVHVQGESVFYVRPGQVHFVPSFQGTKGWALAIDSMLVEKEYKNMFEEQFITQRPITIGVSLSARMNQTANLLHTVMQAEPTAFSNRIILNLANVFIGIIAEQYAVRQENLQHNKSRSALITHQFKELLSENFRTIKSPIQYARKLNYSLSHLNESVKKTTGSPVSYWIHQQIVLEAKRLLYYTGMDVKEIAFSLGYEDHTYFSRLFAKVAGMPPNTFRHKFHE
ncbi:MAG: helix-turn-helix domain-containing protein [Bacteroidales bacterium]|jgi:AraC-like DNA-binding protein|nr:helix-turn-helix domain-containing protein [Bacteroidales bacterium]